MIKGKVLLIIVIISCLLLTSCTSQVNDGMVETVTQTTEEIQVILDNTLYGWMEQSVEYDDAINTLSQYKDHAELKDVAKEYIELITIEHTGYELYSTAENYYLNEEYSKAMETISLIDSKYSRKNNADLLYDLCKEIVLLTVSDPVTTEEYDGAINYLVECIEDINDIDFMNRKTELTEELISVKSVDQIIKNATYQYNEELYKQSFMALENGVKKYPDSVLLSECLQGFYDLYVVEVFKKVEKLCEEKQYKEALAFVDDALVNYDCDEFDLLKETIKEKKNPLYKLKNDLIKKFDSLSNSWETEELTVQKVATSTGNYVIKSGKKLVLGDYSEDSITVLSFGANIIAALANLDFIFDIRDLSYDIVHWGEEEHFLLYLTADVVALIPVLGMVKYFNLVGKNVDNVKDVSNVVDNIADVAKNSDNIMDLLKNFPDISKNVNRVEDVVDETILSMRKNDYIQDTILNLRRGFTRTYNTINSSLINDVHPITGVPFVEKYIKYTYVDDLIAVFPQFEFKYQLKLSDELWNATDAIQFRKCNNALYEEISNNKFLKDLFNEDQIKQLSKGETPSGYTWHHSEDEGIMQLVDSDIHNKTGHTGGRFFWGGESECRYTNCLISTEN